jgi:uncharacterized membrane protein
MTRRRLLGALDTRRVEASIAAVERACAVELRISIAGLFWGSPDRMARRAFDRLGMSATRQRNGLLLFVAPWHKRVVIFADEGITAKVSPTLWTDAVTVVTAAFRDGHFTDGLVRALEQLGRALAPHFPPGARPNELRDDIDRGS